MEHWEEILRRNLEAQKSGKLAPKTERPTKPPSRRRSPREEAVDKAFRRMDSNRKPKYPKGW